MCILVVVVRPRPEALLKGAYYHSRKIDRSKPTIIDASPTTLLYKDFAGHGIIVKYSFVKPSVLFCKIVFVLTQLFSNIAICFAFCQHPVKCGWAKRIKSKQLTLISALESTSIL